jgi:hypothetical protein
LIHFSYCNEKITHHSLSSPAIPVYKGWYLFL